MNGTALAQKHGVSKMAVSKKVKVALSLNLNSIELNGEQYRFVLLQGRYTFTLVETVKLLDVADFESFSLEKRKDAQLKLDLVKAYLERGDLSFEQFMQKLPVKYQVLNVKPRQFFRWLKDVQTCEKGKSPLPLLLDRRGKAPKAKKFNKQMQDKVVEMYLAKPHRAVRRMYEYLQTLYDDVPSYEIVRKFVDKYKQTHEFEVAFAMSPDKAKGKFKPAGGSMSAHVLGSNMLWELDATPADVICSDGKRYTLSGMIDVYSRRVIVTVEASSSSYAIGRLMRKAILKFGVPNAVKIDNGKDYLSNHFASMCDRLQINRILCPPYSGEYKPHVERFFKTLSHELFEEIDGYIGHSVADRQSLQDQTSHRGKMESRKAWRQSHRDGNEFAHKFALKKENMGLVVDVPLSPQELQEAVDAWVTQKYETRTHSSLKCTPLEKYHGAVERRMDDERELDILLGMETTRTIRKKGIEWQGVAYWSEVFGDIVGQKVYVLSDNNLGHVYIYSMNKEYICKALNPAMHEIDRSAYTGAVKKWNKKVTAQQKLVEEIRAEEPSYMMDSLKLDNNDTAETTQEQHTDPLAKQEEPLVLVGEMPIFKSLFEKFCWALAHAKVDEKIEKLAKKHPESWELACLEQNQNLKVG